jgi:UDP-N-acetylglucosamine 4,6-dehydratase
MLMKYYIFPSCKTKIVGIRPGEKLNEEMITETDALRTIDIGRNYAIFPTVFDRLRKEDFLYYHCAAEVDQGFRYNSGANIVWETVESLREKMKEYYDLNFREI